MSFFNIISYLYRIVILILDFRNVSIRNLAEHKRKVTLRIDGHGVTLHGTTVAGSMIGIAHRGSRVDHSFHSSLLNGHSEDR